jgi:hypothetical protein
MKGDFSRWSFNPAKHFSRVLMQQGRVQLDADWNEQVSIFLHYLRTLATDLIGQHGGPAGNKFKVVSCIDEEGQPIDCTELLEPNPQKTFYILPGHYYVDGILCVHSDDKVIKYEDQPGCSADDLRNEHKYLAYLDVWERHITYYEDEVRADDPSIREVALGGIDTTTRAQVVWQVKAADLGDEAIGIITVSEELRTELETIQQEMQDRRRILSFMHDLADLVQVMSDDSNTQSAVKDMLNATIGQFNERADVTIPDDILPDGSELGNRLDELNNLPDLIELPNESPETGVDDLKAALTSVEAKIVGVEAEIDQIEILIQNNKQDIEEDALTTLRRQDKIPQLKAWAASNGNSDNSPCTVPPDAQYRGAENQLYRVEIHQGSLDKRGEAQTASFKWSRENGSIAFRIEKRAGTILTLKDWWPDSHRGLQLDDWVEIIDDDIVLHQQPGHLVQVDKIDEVAKRVTIRNPDNINLPEYDEGSDKHPLLRRWESGPIAIDTASFDLEDGIKIEFDDYENKEFRTGDYWLIPARTEIGNIIWPGLLSNPDVVAPHGIEHHYAPLAIIEVNDDDVQVLADCRRIFEPLGKAATSEAKTAGSGL